MSLYAKLQQRVAEGKPVRIGLIGDQTLDLRGQLIGMRFQLPNTPSTA